MENLKIEYLPVESLKPYEKNARRHEEADVQTIVNSIREFGFDDPIGVWGDENLIVEGHGRLLAAKQLGMDKVPCVRLDHLTDEQRRAYAIAHNKTAEQSMWDTDFLSEELIDLKGAFDMTDFGFGDFELEMLTEDLEAEPYDDNVVSEYSEKESEYLAKQRVIITFTDEQVADVLELLGVDSLTKVVFDINELKK